MKLGFIRVILAEQNARNISKTREAKQSLHPLPPPATASPWTVRLQKFSPAVCLLSVFLRISVFPFLSVSLLHSSYPRPRSPGLETPRRRPGHSGAFHGFLHTLHHGEGNTGVFLSSAHEKERGFDKGGYFFLIYNPEAQCSRPRRP